MIGGIIAASAGHRRAVGGLDPDAQLYINAMTTPPSAARQTIINQLFLDLKAATVFTLIDELWLLAAHASQASLLGIKRYKDCIAVNAPSFVPDRGWTTATNNYLRTSYTPSVDGVQFTLNSGSWGVYLRTDSGNSNGVHGGEGVGNSGIVRILSRYSDGLMYAYLHDVAPAPAAGATAASLGLHLARRSASNALQAYFNGAQIASVATLSGTICPAELYLGVNNNNGSPGSGWDSREISAAVVGAAMTAGQQLSLFNALETYLDAIGAGVVP